MELSASDVASMYTVAVHVDQFKSLWSKPGHVYPLKLLSGSYIVVPNCCSVII